jgi:membrane protein
MRREMRGCRVRKGTSQPIKALVLKLGCKGATVWSLLKTSAMNWMAHKDARLGAALAYYSIFSLGPITIIAMAVAGLFFGRDVVEGEVSAAMRGLLGETGAQGVQTMLAGASKPSEGLVATLIGTGALLFAAIGVVVQLAGSGRSSRVR